MLGRSAACEAPPDAIGCATTRDLQPGPGGSLVTATGHLTGRVTSAEGTRLHGFELDQIAVLAGAPLPARLDGWLDTVPDPGTNPSPALVPGLWAPDGRLLALVPAHLSDPSYDTTLGVRPIVDGAVVFSAAGCTGAPAALRTTAFTGPLDEVPGGGSPEAARCHSGHRQAPLRLTRPYW